MSVGTFFPIPIRAFARGPGQVGRKMLSPIIIGAALCVWLGCQRTVLPPNFDPRTFDSVRVSDSVEEVIQKLGPPLRIARFSLDPRWKPLPGRALFEIVSSDQIPSAAREPDRCLVL